MSTRHTRTTTRTAALLTAVAGLVLTSAGAASAQTVKHKDTHADVVRYTTADGDAASVPDQVDGDVARTRLSYAGKVAIVVHYVDLRHAGAYQGLVGYIDTNEGVHRRVVLSAKSGDWAGYAWLSKPNGKEVACKGITHKIDYRADTSTIRVPRSCLSYPRWVQIALTSFILEEDDDDGLPETVDDALADGPVTDRNIPLVESRRIHRAT